MKTIQELVQALKQVAPDIDLETESHHISNYEYCIGRECRIFNNGVSRLKIYLFACKRYRDRLGPEEIEGILNNDAFESLMTDICVAMLKVDSSPDTFRMLVDKLFKQAAGSNLNLGPKLSFKEIAEKIIPEDLCYGYSQIMDVRPAGINGNELYSCWAVLLAKRDFSDHVLVSNYSEDALFRLFWKPFGCEDAFYEQVLASPDSLKEFLTTTFNRLPRTLSSFQYCDPDHVLDWYCKYIDRCMELGAAKDCKYYSRYTTICQSAGYGKTRLSIELDKEFFVIYICLRRPAISATYRHSRIADYFCKLETVVDFHVFYTAIFSQLIKLFSRVPDDFCIFEGSFHHHFSRLLLDESSKTSEGRLFWEGVQRESVESPKPIMGDCRIRLKAEAVFEELQALLEARGVFKKFVFVIDEACSFVERSVFGEWRRAVAEISKELPFFFVLLDTAGRMGDRTPINEFDRSARVFVSGNLLYPPMYLLPFANLVKPNDEKLCKFQIEAKVDSEDSRKYTCDWKYIPILVFQKSRPMFLSAYYESKEQWKAIYPDIVRSAKSKLICAKTITASDEATQGLQYMAILSCRVPLCPTDSQTTDAMVSQHMSTLVHVSETRDIIKSCYVPETILQEAAAHLLRGRDSFEQSLKHLHHRLRCGQFEVATSKGDIGELVASVCLLRAYDCLIPLEIDASCEDIYMTPRTTQAFFRSLIGPKAFKELELGTALPCGFLSFTKWHRVEGKICGQLLLDAFKWRCAIVCHPVQSGFDLVIPCVRPRTNGSDQQGAAGTNDDDGLTAADMFPIYVQVTNRADAFPPEELTKAIKRIHQANEEGGQFDTYFSILFQIGTGSMADKVTKVQRHQVKREGHLRQTLIIPSIDALTRDSLVLSRQAKQQLKSTAHMQVLYESKKVTIQEMQLKVPPYHSFFETMLTKWSLSPTKTKK